MTVPLPNHDTVLKSLVLVVLLAVILSVGVAAVPQSVGADHSYVVLSDSMSPSINAGDLVVVSEIQPSQIEKGDVITFNAPGFDDPEQRTTHRVVSINEEGESRSFQTKGDANDAPDGEPVAGENVIGVVTFHIPYVGYVVNFANSSLGILTLIVIPAIVLLIAEVRDILSQNVNTDEVQSKASSPPDRSGD